MIGLCHLMAGDDSRMTGDCCRPEGSIHRCVRTHSHLYSYIYGLVASVPKRPGRPPTGLQIRSPAR